MSMDLFVRLIYNRLMRLQYAEEREHPEWVDHGGES